MSRTESAAATRTPISRPDSMRHRDRGAGDAEPEAAIITYGDHAANLVASWIPSLQGVKAKLEAGARVADVGCGKGASTVFHR